MTAGVFLSLFSAFLHSCCLTEVFMKKLFTTIAIAMTVSGCAQQSFAIKNTPAGPTPTSVTTHDFFLYGIGQKKVVNAALICGGADKVVRTEVEQTAINSVLSYITLGIYTPREARVYCQK
jgi:hypothetical protein